MHRGKVGACRVRPGLPALSRWLTLVSGVGFGVRGSGPREQGSVLGFRVQDFGFRAQGFGFLVRVWDVVGRPKNVGLNIRVWALTSGISSMRRVPVST